MPSKTELRRLAAELDRLSQKAGLCSHHDIGIIREATKIVGCLADERRGSEAHNEPEPPKVETLHETKIRFRKRNAQGCSDIAADLCAIILRCHLQLLDLLLHEQRRLGGSVWVQSELQRMRDEADQMLEGSGE